eukprot:5040877-Amphidinium_carterae.1
MTGDSTSCGCYLQGRAKWALLACRGLEGSSASLRVQRNRILEGRHPQRCHPYTGWTLHQLGDEVMHELFNEAALISRDGKRTKTSNHRSKQTVTPVSKEIQAAALLHYVYDKTCGVGTCCFTHVCGRGISALVLIDATAVAATSSLPAPHPADSTACEVIQWSLYWNPRNASFCDVFSDTGFVRRSLLCLAHVLLRKTPT